MGGTERCALLHILGVQKPLDCAPRETCCNSQILEALLALCGNLAIELEELPDLNGNAREIIDHSRPLERRPVDPSATDLLIDHLVILQEEEPGISHSHVRIAQAQHVATLIPHLP